jgi:hypothetical protein
MRDIGCVYGIIMDGGAMELRQTYTGFLIAEMDFG